VIVEREVEAGEALWHEFFAAAREQVPFEWSDFAVEILTVLTVAGRVLGPEASGVTLGALLWFLRHRSDVLHEAQRWAGLEIVTFRSVPGLGPYSNERALLTLRQIRTRLGGI
jgi:hypothetical protein